MAFDVSAVFSPSPAPPLPSPSPPGNVSRGIVEPFTGYPKGVAYAAGYIFILHESGQMYRCNVSNQHETCYQQNEMYRGNAFNWIASGELDTSFARRMAVEDDEHIITSSGEEIYRCSTMNPYSCTTFFSSNYERVQTIVVGGGRIFASYYNSGLIVSLDLPGGWVHRGDGRVSSLLSMRRLSVWSITLRDISTWGEGYGIQPQR